MVIVFITATEKLVHHIQVIPDPVKLTMVTLTVSYFSNLLSILRSVIYIPLGNNPSLPSESAQVISNLISPSEHLRIRKIQLACPGSYFIIILQRLISPQIPTYFSGQL